MFVVKIISQNTGVSASQEALDFEPWHRTILTEPSAIGVPADFLWRTYIFTGISLINTEQKKLNCTAQRNPKKAALGFKVKTPF